jgi:hypothetical protein
LNSSRELPEQQFTWIRPLVVVVAPTLSKATVQVQKAHEKRHKDTDNFL